MKITTEITVPQELIDIAKKEGYEVVGFRPPKRGDIFYSIDGEIMSAMYDLHEHEYRFILRKKEKQLRCMTGQEFLEKGAVLFKRDTLIAYDRQGVALNKDDLVVRFDNMWRTEEALKDFQWSNDNGKTWNECWVEV